MSLRQDQINKGRFLVIDLTEIPEYMSLNERITDNLPNYHTLKLQLKEAFMFQDRDMIEEIKDFILSNIPYGLFAV